MRLIQGNVTSFRMLVLVWAPLWMLAPPVHIHPEADHRHGAEDQQHGGQSTLFFPQARPVSSRSITMRRLQTTNRSVHFI